MCIYVQMIHVFVVAGEKYRNTVVIFLFFFLKNENRILSSQTECGYVHIIW